MTGHPAVAWTGPGQASILDHSPQDVGSGELLIRVRSAGICGTDLTLWRGDHPHARPGTVMGHEFGGTVEDVGSGVTGWHHGDAVAVDPNVTCGQCPPCGTGARGLCDRRRLMGIDLDGGFRTFAVIAAGQAIPTPTGTDPHCLALVEPFAVAVHAGTRAGIQPGMSVGVIGGGPIGMAVALHAQNLGAARITVVEADPNRREIAAHRGFDTQEPAGTVDGRWDVAVDTVARATTLEQAMRAVAPGSTICVVGLTRDLMPPAQTLVRRELTLTGSFCYTRDDLTTAAALVAAHGLGAIPVDLVRGLHHAPATLQALAQGRPGTGKALLVL